MSVIPKTKFMWLLVAVVAYAYYQEHAEKKKHLPLVAETVKTEAAVESKPADAAVKPAEDSTKTTSNIVATKADSVAATVLDKISQNETGKVIMDALLKKSMEKQYGNKDLGVIAAGASGGVITIDLLKGTGSVANCGAKAVINYEAFNSHDMKFDSTKLKNEEKPLTVQLGSGQVIKGLEAGIVGMRQGGTRKISIAARLAFDMDGFTNSVVSKGETVSYYVNLVEIKDGPYKTDKEVKIINDIPARGSNVLCGDNIKVKYDLYDDKGAQIPNGLGEAEFIVGAGSVPVGFEKAVIGMGNGAKKTVQIPYELLKPAVKTTLPETLKFKEGVAVTATIEILQGADINTPQGQ